MTARRLGALPRDEEGRPLAASLGTVAKAAGRSAGALLGDGLKPAELAGRAVVREAECFDLLAELDQRSEADAAHGRDL